MTNQITTLEQAGKHLMEQGVVNFENMTVEGKKLLDVCGYNFKSNTNRAIKRQILRRGLIEEEDYFKTSDGRYEFSLATAKVMVLSCKNTLGLVVGYGVNDADYKVTHYKDGKLVWVCPYYLKWKNMLVRCYDESAIKRRPTYRGCSVCEDWLTFSNFKVWAESCGISSENINNYHLDKDIKVLGNTLYSPDTCVFVTNTLNMFLTNVGYKNHSYTGVSKRPSGKYAARCSDPFKGKVVWLGTFDTKLSANCAWKRYKLSLLVKLKGSEFSSKEVDNYLENLISTLQEVL